MKRLGSEIIDNFMNYRLDGLIGDGSELYEELWDDMEKWLKNNGSIDELNDFLSTIQYEYEIDLKLDSWFCDKEEGMGVDWIKNELNKIKKLMEELK